MKVEDSLPLEMRLSTMDYFHVIVEDHNFIPSTLKLESNTESKPYVMRPSVLLILLVGFMKVFVTAL